MSLLLMMARARINHQASYAVWNPSDSAPNIGFRTYSLGSNAYDSVNASGVFKSCRANKSFTGKTYIELARNASGGGGAVVSAGVMDAAFTLTANTYSSIASTGMMAWGPNGNVYNAASLKGTQAGGPSVYTFGVAIDPTTRKVWFTAGQAGPSATWLGGGDPAAGTSPTCTLGGSGLIYPAACPFSGNLDITLVSDPANMVGTAPSGFTAGL